MMREEQKAEVERSAAQLGECLSELYELVTHPDRKVRDKRLTNLVMEMFDIFTAAKLHGYEVQIAPKPQSAAVGE